MDCFRFLGWALPRLGLREQGFARVRRQVCKRLSQRLRELELGNLEQYQTYLADHPGEWDTLESFCHITISRFFRDRAVFDQLLTILPQLAERARARGESALCCWSAGCGAGEEPYSVAALWQHQLAPAYPDLTLQVTATDADLHQLTRARKAVYRASSLREVPSGIRDVAFVRRAPDAFEVVEEIRSRVTFLQQDLRRQAPKQTFWLILCRNLAFTYFDEKEQLRAASLFGEHLHPGGVLVVGKGEEPPLVGSRFRPLRPLVFERADTPVPRRVAHDRMQGP